jgi:hypothetical protein
MDETKGKPQDSLQKPGQTSGGTEGTTPKTEPKTYTEEEVNKAIEKAKNDALAKAGRDAKSLELREKSLTEREDAVKAKEEAADAAEAEEAKSDPNKMRSYQVKQARKQQEADLSAEREKLKKDREELERDKAEHEAEVNAAKEVNWEITLWDIAEELGIDPVKLKDSCKDLEITTAEGAKKLAKTMSPSKSPEPIHIDSGVNSGTRGTLTPEQFEKLPQDEKKKYLKM